MRASIVFVLLVIAGAAYAEVYTWVDADGNTHYSDKPPADRTAEQLDLETQQVTTVGGSGLRPGEQALLEQIRKDEQAARERRQRERELRALAEERRLAEERERAASTYAPDESVRYRRVYPYPVIPRRAYRTEPRFGLSLEYRGDNFRLRGAINDDESRHHGPPRRPSHHFKHRNSVKQRDRGVTHGMSGVSGRSSFAANPDRLTP